MNTLTGMIKAWTAVIQCPMNWVGYPLGYLPQSVEQLRYLHSHRMRIEIDNFHFLLVPLEPRWM